MSEQTTNYEEMTLKELQAELTAMDFLGAEVLTTKAQVIKVIEGLKKKEEDAIAKMPSIALSDPMADVDNAKLDEKKYFGKAALMKAHLDAQPKVDFIIPLAFGEKRGAIETWQANGYRLNIMKGVRVKLPAQVADSLADAYQLTAVAGEEYSLDRPSTDRNAPYKTVREALE
jgi:hypothetical protein